MQHTHDGQHSLQPAIVYAFDVGGRTYQGTQIRAGDSVMRVNVSGDAAMIVNRYPVGAIVQIYYNPLNPNEAALER